ncbi:MAG: hypothetical protein ACW98K_13195 [Candidatus Kariarchaeaceae archaeon]|jgi:hypothetical protein
MFDAYLGSITNLNPNHQDYARDLLGYIKTCLEEERPFYAVHGHCTDGGTAGAMIRYAIPEAAIIPIDYWILNDPIARPLLQELPWKGIVDLEPFNQSKIDFWVDHHLSSVGKPVNSHRIRFDVDGDSGAWQLLLSSFIGEMPDHLVELAVMTRTTDTAGYITPPPIDSIHALTDLDLTVTVGEEGRKQEEQRIWLLDDAWGSTFSLKEHLQLYNYLAKDGFYGLSNILDRINQRRDKRKIAVDIANEIDVSSDIVLFSFQEQTADKFTILRRLQERGALVVGSLSISAAGVRISLRRNRSLDPSLAEKIQLNELAELMNGGGHAGASGADANSVEEAYTIISEWAKSLQFSVNLHELSS